MDIDAVGNMLELKGLTHSEIDAFFEHAGVKGMRWGVRKSKSSSKKIKVPSSKAEKVGKAATVAMLAAFGVTTLATIKMGH